MNQELDLTTIVLPEIKAEEIRELYKKAMHDYDLRRAVMFLKLIRYSYSSSGKSFACQPFSVRSLFGLIQDFSIRMENAVIENQDFQVLISHYDRPDAFFYCDPPYFSSEYVYECGFTWKIMCASKAPWQMQKANGWCPTMTARRSGAIPGIRIF